MTLRDELKEVLIDVANLEDTRVEDISDTTLLFGDKVGLTAVSSKFAKIYHSR